MRELTRRLFISISCCGAVIGYYASTRRPSIRVRILEFAEAEGSHDALYALIREAEDMTCSPMRPSELQHDIKGSADILLVPGGRAGKQAAELGQSGCSQVRKFIRSGGGYVGICAGAFLALQGNGMLGILNMRSKVLDKTIDIPRWGEVSRLRYISGNVTIGLTDKGMRLLNNVQREVTLVYGGGPILDPIAGRAGDVSLSEPDVLASYLTEPPSFAAIRGEMIGSPAIVRAKYGQGNVLVFAPHPDLTHGAEDLVIDAIRLVSARL